MSKKFVRILCLVLSVVLALGLLAGALATVVSAAVTTYQLTQLLADGKIKPLGRTQTNLAGDGITADWSGSGFDIKVSGDGGTMTVGFSSNYSAYWAILVDGTQVWRGATSATTDTFGAAIPAGEHTVRVVKETQMSSATNAYSKLTTLSFDGTIETAPANKSLYIEFVGDSITCGDGALGEYEPGVKWLGSHDSATHGYAYYAAQKLGADYSLVARGGIGLFTGISEAEGTPQKAGMQDIYNYVSAYCQDNGEYGFTRQPNVVFIELGANDSVSTSSTASYYSSIGYWKSLMEAFIDQVRGKNPNAQIVLHSTNATKYKALMEIVESRKESDPKIHAFYYSYLGNGSAALDTQYAGHPDASDHEHFADALVKFLKSEDIVPTNKSTPSYNDITYYVSENGSNSNTGKSIDAAKLTLQSAIDQARTDNTFAPGSRVVVYVQGTVKNGNNSQSIALRTVTDTAGAKVPILVTTYNYSGTKAVLNSGHAATNDGNGSLVFYNDVTLKDITFQSTTNASSGYRDRNLYSGYNNIVFDNVTFDMNGDTPTNNSGWRISCGTAFGSDPLPTTMTVGSITFKNGDYTNLNFATAVISSGMWKSSTETIYDVPYADFRLIIEDGAKMGTVYNRYGNLNVGASSVTINGGSVQQYVGTGDGTSSANKTYKGDINLTVNGGHISGTHFSTAGSYVTVDGDINTTINGGIFNITPRSTADQYDAYFFGGRQKCIVENINTTITGGHFNLIFDVAEVDSGYYFGVSGNGSAKNVTNKISGGVFMPIKNNATPKHASIYFGVHTGTITGTLRNEISGGNFVLGSSGISPAFVFGSRGVNWSIGKLENVIGTKGSTHGPVFSGGTTYLGGNWAQIGVSAKQSSQPTVADCSDTVVISNTIYSGSFANVHLSATSGANTGSSQYSFVKGSVHSDIYGGFFQGKLYGGGNTQLYGHATTNIYGGHFQSIYGASYSGNRVFDGVELNIYGMDEYYPVNPSNKWVISGGSETGSVPAAHTAGRDSIRLTIAPEKASELVLNTPIQVGTTAGTTSVSVSGGTFPQGFAVSGKTVGEALASGCVVFDTSTGAKAGYAASDASVPGAVAVDRNADTYVNELVYYVSENGQDAYSGTSPVTPKKTLRAAFSEVIADNGGSYKFPAGTKLTIYVEGTVNNDAGTGQQQLGGGQVLIHGNDLHDHVPVTITTYNYNGKDKAMIVDNHLPTNSGNASAYVVNDLYFKNIDLQSVTNPATGYADTNFYAAGCSVTFDNCAITTDGKATAGGTAWKINADHFSTGGFNPLNTSFLPLYGSVTFKNGDYTNLSRVSAVGASSIWQSSGSVYSIPQMYCKVVIEDGAKMGTVYNAYGTLGVGSATVEIKGGTVENYFGTVSGTADAKKTYNTNLITVVSGGTVASYTGSGNYVTINGDVNNTFSGGNIGGCTFYTLGDGAVQKGNMNNTFSGAKLEINPTDTNQGHGIYMAGRNSVTIEGDVTNNISAGSIGVLYKVSKIDSGIYLGLRGGTIKGNLTNNISGGELYTKAESGITTSYASIHTTGFSGASVAKTVTNNITGGTFTVASGSIYLGQRGVSGYANRVVNVIGDEETKTGPVFHSQLLMGGGWGRVGATSNSGTLPTEADVTDTVVISNTIYGGTFNGDVNCALNATTTATNIAYVKGSVKTDIYGGSFGNVYAGGVSPVYGHVTLNVHGGTFNAIYGTKKSQIFDGIELNIYGMTEGADPTGIWAGGDSGTVQTKTEGRPAVKLTIDPKDTLTLSMPISAGCSGTGTVTGTTSVLVTGGTYTNGFAVSGVTVKAALADGLVPLKDADKTVVPVTDTMTTTGTDSVTLVTTGWTEETAVLTLSDTTVTYDGKTDAKIPTTTVKFHNSELVKDTDYTVSYSRDGKATTDLNSLGTVTVTVTAKAPWSGSLTAEYTIIRAGAVAEAIQSITQRVGSYDENTVTADDSADLAALKTEINGILTDNADVLTAEEKAALQELLTDVKALEDVISSVGSALTGMVEWADAYKAEIVTADDSTALNSLENALTQLNDGNLTKAQKEQKQASLEKVDAMQKVITDTAAALAEVKEEADAIDNTAVTADDSGELTALAADIAAIPDSNLTAAQKTEKQAAADKVAAAQKVITDTAKALADAKTATDAINGNTVNSDQSDELTALAAQIAAIPDGNLTAAQKTEKRDLATKVETLQQILADTAADLKSLRDREAAFVANKLTSDDKAGLQTLLKDLQEYPTDHLNGGEQELLVQLACRVEDKLAVIAKAEQIAGDIGAIEALLNGKTTANVTSGDATDVQAAKRAIEELKKDISLTDADKAKLAQLEQKADSLTAQLDKADQADEISTEVETIKPETVEKDDKAALEEAIAKLEQAEKDYSGNYTEAEKKAIEDKKAALEAALAVIEEVETVQKQIADLPAAAQPDDEKTIAALEAARAAYGELNERQQGMVTAAELEKLDKLDKLAASLKDYKLTKGDKAAWNLESGKDLSFTANGLFAKFEGIQVDGTTVDSKYYTAKSGSTVITLSDDYLNTLKEGEHKLTVVYTDGSVVGTFTVKAKVVTPSTGDSTNVILLSLLAVFSVTAAAAVTISMKKRTR